MTKNKNILIFISFLFFIAISFPLIAIFNTSKMIFGFPTMLVYLFGVWATLVVTMIKMSSTENKKTK